EGDGPCRRSAAGEKAVHTGRESHWLSVDRNTMVYDHLADCVREIPAVPDIASCIGRDPSVDGVRDGQRILRDGCSRVRGNGHLTNLVVVYIICEPETAVQAESQTIRSAKRNRITDRRSLAG